MLFPFQIQLHLLSEKRKLAVKKYQLTSQHKLPDSELLSFFLSHKRQLPSVSSPSNREWSSPCRCLCACKTRVRQCIWDGREKPILDLSSASSAVFGQASTCLGSHTLCRPLHWYWTLIRVLKGSARLPHGNGQKGNETFPSPGSFQQTCLCILSLRPTQDCGSCMQLLSAQLPPLGDKTQPFSKVKENVAFKMLKTSRNPVGFLPSVL